MQSIFDAITEWLKGLLVEGIMGNLGGLFTNVNEQVGEIAAQVGTTPAAWNAGVFSMIRQLSETVILPIAGLVLTFVMTYELIQMLIDHNNLHNFDTWIFFKWIFKTFVEMYAEPETSFGDITRYFEEQGIKIYGKSLTRPFLSQLLRNPVYAQADLEMYEFFKSQGAVVVNDAADFAGTNGCYLYQGRDVKEDKDKSLKDQILVIAPHEGFVPSDIWLRCRKKLMTNITFQNGRKARNTWLAGKIKCGKCGYALKTTHNPSGYEYLRCSKRADHKGCPGCGTLRKNEFEQFIFTAMGEKFREFKLLRGGEEKANPKITAYQVELAQVEAEIEKLLDTLTGANATLLAYANKKIEDLDNRRKTLSKAIADLSVETLSSQQIELLSGYLDDWENISFEDKRKAADGLISSISATSDYVKIEWKI